MVCKLVGALVKLSVSKVKLSIGYSNGARCDCNLLLEKMMHTAGVIIFAVCIVPFVLYTVQFSCAEHRQCADGVVRVCQSLLKQSLKVF